MIELYQGYRSGGGELVESKLGDIPKGWRVGSVLEIATLLSGGTPKVSDPAYWDGEVKWVSAKDISASNGSFVYDTERKITLLGLTKSAAKLLPEGTTVITARGSVGNYCILAEPMTINQSNYGLKSKKADADWYLFVLVSNMIQMMQQHAHGTIFDTITTKTFENMHVILPEQQVIKAYNKLIEPLLLRIKRNGIQSRTLATLRDTLLPQLLNGRLTVRQTAEMVA